MARIPRSEQQQDFRPSGRIIQADRTPVDDSVARGLMAVGRAGVEISGRLQQAKQNRELITAENTAREQLDKLKADIELDKSIADDQVATRFRESAEKIIGDSASRISSANARKDWSVQSQRWLSEGANWSGKLVVNRQVDRTRAAHVTSMATLETDAGDLSISATAYQNRVGGERELVEQSRASGFLSDEQAADYLARLDGLQRADQTSRKQATIDGLVRSGNRAEAVKLIEQEGSFEEKSSYYRVMNAVEDEMWQARQRDRQAEEQARVELARESSKTMDELYFSKGLTPQWMRQNRDRLSEEDYTRGWNLLGDVAEGDVKSNANIYAELTYRSAAGEDVSADAMRALTQGLLSKIDAGSIISRSGNNVEQPSWSMRGLEYISNSLKPSDLNDDPARNLRFAGAVEEWREFVDRQTSPPSRADMQKEMDAIVQSYSIVAPSQVAEIALPAPRTLGRRPQSTADLQEWQRQLQAGAANMTTAELQREMELLKKWQTALSQQGAQ